MWDVVNKLDHTKFDLTHTNNWYRTRTILDGPTRSVKLLRLVINKAIAQVINDDLLVCHNLIAIFPLHTVE